MRISSKMVSCALSALLAIGCVPAAAFAESASIVGGDLKAANNVQSLDSDKADASVGNVEVVGATNENVAAEDGSTLEPADELGPDETNSAVTVKDVNEATDEEIVANDPIEEGDTSELALSSAEVVSGVALSLLSSESGDSVDVAGGSSENGAAIQLWTDNGTLAQRFRFEEAGDGAYVIVAVGSGKVLDVEAGQAKAGTKVHLYQFNGSAAQKWYPVEMPDGSLGFSSALISSEGEAFYLSANALEGSAQLSIQRLGIGLQGWIANPMTQAVADGVYTIASASNEGFVLDVAGAEYGSGANIQIYRSNGSSAQRFQVSYDKSTGYYKIVAVSSGKALDVSGGSKYNAANVQQYSSNNTFAQRWTIESAGTGFVVKNANSSLALDVDGARFASGSNVQQYVSNGTAAQLWSFQSTTLLDDGVYVISAAENKEFRLDIDGAGKVSGTNVQLYHFNQSNAQRFTVAQYGEGNAYVIVNHASGMALTATGDSSGSNVSQNPLTHSDSQLWTPVLTDSGLTLVNAASGKVLDVNGGMIGNGSNVQVWTANGTPAQGFVFSSVDVSSETLVGVTTKVGGRVVESSPYGDALYLFLGSSADLSALPLSVVSVSGATSAYYATSAAGSYEAFKSGSKFDLLSLGCYNDSKGAYELYVKVNPEDEGRLVRIMKSSDIPTMYIISNDPISEGRYYVDSSPDHSAKASATMVLVQPDGTITYGKSSSGITIKGRGNSTWTSSKKKPYQIKLDKKTDLLNTGDSSNKNKTWVLLANAADATLLHNTVAYDLALELGMVESPQSEPIDLYYDGVYLGNYLLSEKVQTGTGRVDIEDLDDANEEVNPGVDIESLPTAKATNKYGYTFSYVVGVKNPSDISGGYIVELDDAYYGAEVSWFQTSLGTFVIKSPEFASEKEARYISECMQEAINKMTGKGETSSISFDVDTLAKVYLINELTKNTDAYCTSSMFYKAEGSSTIYCGPVWDYDTCVGTRDVDRGGTLEYAYGGYSGSYRTFVKAMLSNSQVVSKIKSIYSRQLNGLVSNVLLGDAAASGNVLKSLTYYADLISDSQGMDQVVWGITAFGNCIAPLDTWEANVTYMRNWLKWRNQWLFNRIASWSTTGLELTNTPTIYKGVNYALVFDAHTYLDSYKDLAAAYGTNYSAALEHFVKYGMAEGRQAASNFNVYAYKARYADLRAAFGNDLSAYYYHYINYGFAEGRNAL